MLDNWIKSGWFYKAVLLIVPLIVWGFILKSFFTKKEPYQYISMCVPHEIRCEDRHRFGCLSQSVFEGLVRDKGKCEYLKIPTIFKPRANRNDIEINLPLNVVVPDIKEKHKGEFDETKITIRLGGNANILYSVNQTFVTLEGRSVKPEKIKIFNLDATVLIKSALTYKVFPEIHIDRLGSDAYRPYYHLDMTIVTKDKTAILSCSEHGHEKLELINIVNISQNMNCHVNAAADDSLSYNYYLIPSHVINRFKEINVSYSNMIKSFKYDIKH